jgi:hypothetical protein
MSVLPVSLRRARVHNRHPDVEFEEDYLLATISVAESSGVSSLTSSGWEWDAR